MWRDYLVAAGRVLKKPAPFDARHPIYILLETESSACAQAEPALEKFLEKLMEQGLALDAIIPQTHEHEAQLWKFRDSIGEILRDMQHYLALEVGKPLKSMQAFIENVSAQMLQV